MPEPIPLSAIPTLTTLYRTSRLHPSPTPADPSNPSNPSRTPTPSVSASLNAKISLLRTDITTLATTCIVNAANNSLLGGGGVDGAIHSAAGPSLLSHCRPLAGCATGSAKITPAFDLPCRYVIHAVGPVYASARRKRAGLERELLEGAYRTSLELAAQAGEKGEGDEDEGLGGEIDGDEGFVDEGKEEGEQEEGSSIAFSCLSTGIYGYPSAEAADVACRTVRSFLEEQERNGQKGVARVIFCCFLEKDVVAYSSSLPRYFPPTKEDLDAAAAATATATTAAAEGQRQVEEKERGREPDATDLGKEDWIPIDKPQDTMEKSTEMVETPAEGEGMERSEVMSEEGEKIEGEDVSEGEGVQVDVPRGVGGNGAGHGLMRDW